MYKNFVMVALVVIMMPFVLDSSDNQIKQDALRCIRHAIIHDNSQQEFMRICCTRLIIFFMLLRNKHAYNQQSN